MIRLKQLLEQALKDKNSSHTVIFMAGFNPGDWISIDDQRRFLSRGIVSNVNIVVHEYDDLNGVLSSITKNPTAFVVLFAEACINADEVVKKLQNARTMFIVSPGYDPETIQSVRSAISKGVPITHILPAFDNNTANSVDLNQSQLELPGDDGNMYPVWTYYKPKKMSFDLNGKTQQYKIETDNNNREFWQLYTSDNIIWSDETPSTGLNDPEKLLTTVGQDIQMMIDSDILPDIIVQPENTGVSKVNINDFKRQWRALGHTIKISSKYPPPDELTNGGTVDEEMLRIVLELITEYGKLYPGLPKVEITAGNDWYHQHELSYVSVHTLGLAIDLVPHSDRRVLQLEELIKQYKKKYTNFDWINEFTNPSSAATGPHYHLYLKGPVTKTPKY